MVLPTLLIAPLSLFPSGVRSRTRAASLIANLVFATAWVPMRATLSLPHLCAR